LMASLLVLSALIPRGAIEPQMRESAALLKESELFGTAVDGAEGSRIDRYADSILLNIAWNYDAKEPLRSVMLSEYYYTAYQNENDNLYDAVADGAEANRQYLRYWHGSIALLRPLLTVLTLRQIYVLHGVLLAALAAALLTLLVWEKAWGCAAGVLAGMCAAAYWFVPRSLEYYWVCALALALSIPVAALAGGDKRRGWGIFFLVAGMATSFLDFLTAETLTLTVPLLLLLRLRRDEEPPLRLAGRLALTWGCGYVGMWSLKWLLASIVLGENAMPYVLEHIEDRTIGNIMGVPALRLITGSVTNNLKCLFPADRGLVGMMAALAILLAAAYYGYVYRREGWDKRLVIALALTGAVPFVRYPALSSHSYLHCFFTYRALMATVLAAALILEELTRRRETREKPVKQKRR
ncbi:MAG: hypothetical protein J5449_10500, partial [Oscillospiraceae bacterium]|nr:hypothetical protein [Oscillospiraceae bacterium]